MDSFLNFSKIELNESLNTPQEYYMTNDTKMPTSIYAAFSVEDRKYIMCLEETSDKGVYILEVGRIGDNGGKTYWWKFHQPSDILPVLATTLHFVQSATAWMGPKMRGIAVQFKQGASDQMVRATRIAQRIIKKSYVKSFTLVPVAQPAITDKDKYYHQKIRYMFIAKKGIPLSTVFGGSTFKKYSFNGKEAPAEAIEQLEPKKVKKPSNTLKPSKKYSFGQFAIDTPADEELIDKVQKVSLTQSDPTTSAKVKTNDDVKKEYEKALNLASQGGANGLAGMIMAMSAFSSMTNALKKHGFDSSKLNWNNLEYVINNSTTKGEKALLASAGMLDIGNASVKNKWEFVMSKIGSAPSSPLMQDITKDSGQQTKKFLSTYPAGEPAASSNPVGTTAPNKVLKSNIDPKELVATMPGSGIVVKMDGSQFDEVDGSWETKKKHIQFDLGYQEEVAKLKTLNNVVTYSGHQYDKYNQPLRNTMKKLFAGQALTNAEIKELTSNTGKFQKLFKAFNDIKPLPESLWVYRGTSIPGPEKEKVIPGYDFVDPAFLSTSLKPTISFGYDRLRIYLPKGSKVIPILGHSKHPSEQEVLLPPSSVIKVVEVEIVGSNRYAVQGVFTGSAFKSITEMLKKQLTMTEDYDTINSLKEFMMMIEQEDKQPKYEPEGKFGGEYDAELAQLINDAVKKGKVKVDPPKKD